MWRVLCAGPLRLLCTVCRVRLRPCSLHSMSVHSLPSAPMTETAVTGCTLTGAACIGLLQDMRVSDLTPQSNLNVDACELHSDRETKQAGMALRVRSAFCIVGAASCTHRQLGASTAPCRTACASTTTHTATNARLMHVVRVPLLCEVQVARGAAMY